MDTDVERSLDGFLAKLPESYLELLFKGRFRPKADIHNNFILYFNSFNLKLSYLL